MLRNLARYVRTKLHPLRISGMLVRLVGIVQYIQATMRKGFNNLQVLGMRCWYGGGGTRTDIVECNAVWGGIHNGYTAHAAAKLKKKM
jgi:hypothetical protein